MSRNAVLIAMVPLLLAAAIVWTFPLSIARKLLPVMRSLPPDLDIRSRTALGIALAAIGLWVAAMAIVDISYWVILFWLAGSIDTSAMLDPIMKTNILATGIEIVIAASLLSGCKGLSQLALRLGYLSRLAYPSGGFISTQ